jgi:hypothetical protein
MANFPSSFRGWNFGDGLNWHFGQHGGLLTDFFGPILSARFGMAKRHFLSFHETLFQQLRSFHGDPRTSQPAQDSST